jgi:type IV pilus assembly protein PilM
MSAPAWLASPPADAAIEIAEEAITVAVLGSHGRETVVERYAVAPLPPGALVPSLTAANLVNRDAATHALATAVDQLGVRPRRVALVVPDPIARVSLLRFERVPPRRDDLEQLIRWQMKKAAPFPVEDACLTFAPARGNGHGEGDYLVALARREAIREYESLAESIGAHAGLVDLSTLSVLNLYLASAEPPAGDWLLVHLRPTYTSIAILRGADVIFFRTRGHEEHDTLSDFVHQTTMYYQDRLGRATSR